MRQDPSSCRLHEYRDFNLAADYYLSYIEYVNGNTDVAYDGFKEVAQRMNGVNNDGIAPDYYIAQIEYSRAQYDRVIGSRIGTN